MAVFHANLSRLWGQATSDIGLERFDFQTVYARLNATTAIPPGCFYTPAHTVVHLIVEHPNQEGDGCRCAKTSGRMAESVYGGDIQSIDTGH
jgi:hypothetical protein